MLLDLKRRGLAIAPELAIADGALGFWKALGEVWPKTREQRCWVHKAANVSNRLPTSKLVKAKRALQAFWMPAIEAMRKTPLSTPSSWISLRSSTPWQMGVEEDGRGSIL